MHTEVEELCRSLMFLVIEIDPEVQFMKFNWSFHYEVMLDCRDAIIWHLVLCVEGEEWMDVNFPSDSDLLDEIYWFNLCNEEKLE